MKYNLLLASLLATSAFNAFADEAMSLAAHEEVTINCWSLIEKRRLKRLF